MTDNIQALRQAIDKIDQRLAELLNERFSLAGKVIAIKKEQGLPVYAPQREQQIYEQVTAKELDHLDKRTLRAIFERILDESRRTGLKGK